MSHKISCVILTRNEEAKIHLAVTHAMKWADEVVIVDKESTDRTCEIARNLGARITTIPFTRQGHEDLQDYASRANNDWVWGFGSHNIPTRKLVEKAKALVSDDIDLIRIPFFYYSFGVHHDQSPWAGGYQPRLFNRKRVKFTGIAHDPFRAERFAMIDYATDCYVLHQTHATADRFMISHSDYMINEALNGTPLEVIARALDASARFDKVFESEESLFAQQLGWKIYWYGVALHAYEKLHPNTVAEYSARAEEMMKEWR